MRYQDTRYVLWGGDSFFLIVEAIYYSAVCSKELYYPDAEIKFKRYVEDYPEGRFIDDVYLDIGNILFQNKKFTEANKWYKRIDYLKLQPQNNDIYFFRYGYTSFNDSLYSQALFLFKQIKNKNFYNHLATYFSSHI